MQGPFVFKPHIETTEMRVTVVSTCSSLSKEVCTVIPAVMDQVTCDVGTEAYTAEGRHLILTLKDCPPAMLDDEMLLRDICRRAILATGAEILQLSSHHFEPQGVTVLALLAESHASLHTYPEVGVAFWDCFTCGTRCQPDKSADVLIEAFGATAVEQECLVRGDGMENKTVEDG